ncbi:uncharacterized protein PODANS_1_17555 [Podospora anserina S mat+]|uniref:Podospora anserina S mat+ genomic DNA chromosome 1, supercontig 4 n=1 Tax=Podospora anserina (strain S / ATCC MYA-4624 / DSM 980 / FGSC 10383) TaxID=515849 RepID=B2AU04_PODAN|nr:uncharacterized protein PODANS_1_17555 [Podospora anserina S mat+]CAP67877.1 unnamed protein product [Podospora anserina S mat+]CDP24136.1 Putative protein of unknown function [Podospora anserina S mat+]
MRRSDTRSIPLFPSLYVCRHPSKNPTLHKTVPRFGRRRAPNRSNTE